MAVDKLVDSTQLDADLTSVANAIRTKGGTSAQLAFPADFVSAIEAIETGGGGDYVAADFADNTKPTGGVVFSQTTVGASYGTYLAGRTGVTALFGTNWNDTSNFAGQFRNMTDLATAVFPKATRIYNNSFASCSKLVSFDWLGGAIAGSAGQFQNCSKLNIMVIRKTNAVCSLSNINAFAGSPFASGKAGGTLYVPNDLIASYEAASNWSTILGYSTNSIKSIESTHTDPTAPIDLTLYYVDGTPIPT